MNKLLLLGKQLLLAGVAALPLTGQAQQAPAKPVTIKFGQPLPADFEARNFVADSAAAAVVLYDGGAVRFRVEGLGFKMETERTTRLKILKKAGYDYATVEVPLYHRNNDEEKLTGLKGFTYNQADGKLVKLKLENANTFTEERSKNVRVRKFTLPGVREGAVIEYTYTIVSDFFFNLPSWDFQRDIPTRWSEYRAIIPEYFDYKMLMQGYEPLAQQQKEQGTAQYLISGSALREAEGGMPGSGQNNSQVLNAATTSYYWAMKDVPALREEPFMTTTKDYVARIDFELAGTKMPGGVYRNVSSGWTKINSELMESEEFGLVLDRGTFLKEQLQALVAQHADLAARAAAVRELVLRTVKYDGTTGLFSHSSLKHTWEQHRGTAADVNLLLIAALRQAGVPAQPVILSTRAHGRINQSFPLLDQYNYVVGLVELPEGGAQKELLLDATEPMLPAGVLPQRCLNQVGRLVVSNKAGEGRWVDLNPTQRHSHYQYVSLAVDEQGNLTGKVHEEHGGYQGAAVRDRLAELGEKKYFTELASQHTSWEIPTYKFGATADISKPLALDYEMRQPATSGGAASELYLKLLAQFGEGRNPFSHEQRKFPVDFGAASQDVVLVSLTLPPGYVAELPKPTSVALPDQGGTYTFAATSPTPSTVQLISRLNLLKPVYGAEEYANLREFYRLVLAKQAEALVIKKQ